MAFINNKRICVFCENSDQKIDYKDFKTLRKFITDQGKIIPGHVTGVCAKHQRHLGRAIKQSRNIALLPYSVDPRHYQENKMKVVLNQTIDDLGGEGEILIVKDGYARNYLIPKGWAKRATKENIIATQKDIENKQKKEAKTRDNLEALGKQLDKLSLKFELKAGEEGRLFGSVTSQMIVDAIAEKGYTIDKKEVEITETISHVGKYFVNIKLGHGFTARVKIKVSAEK